MMIKFLFIIILAILVYFSFSREAEGFTNNDYVEKNVTICIKTIYRSKLLETNLSEIRRHLPKIKIIVADDSDDEYKLKNKEVISKFENIEYLDLPYDSGLSYGRNKAVEKVNTKYTIIMDDSRTITNVDKIFELAKYLDSNDEYSLICGNVLERGNINGKYTFLFRVNDKAKVKNSIKNNDKVEIKIQHKKIADLEVIDDDLELYQTHVGVNCFIAKTPILKKYKWDNKLKLVEHKHFFLKLYLNNVNVLYCDNFIFKQFSKELREYDKNALQLRMRMFKNNVSFH